MKMRIQIYHISPEDGRHEQSNIMFTCTRYKINAVCRFKS